MNIRNKVEILFLTMITGIALTINPALAHRFNVTLVIPKSNAASVQGRQFLDGFMLATTERDSHPDQESDGHLGGLDVYVTVIDGDGDVAADIGRIAATGEADIVAAFGSKATRSLVRTQFDGKKIALLAPGRSPFSRSDLRVVARFIASYERKYGTAPSSHAAQGYNAARRIDAAVRAQGGADDKASLLRSFRETARGFTW